MQNRRAAFILLMCAVFLEVRSQEAHIFLPKRQWTLGSDADNMFLSVIGIAPLTDGSLLVSDKLSNAILRIDHQGQVMHTRQKKGSDPGTFNGPGPVAAWKRVIAVADFASDRIQLLSAEFEPLREIRVTGSVFSLDFDEDGHLWVGALHALKGETLFKYDRDGTELLRRKTQIHAGSFFDAIFHLVCSGRKIRLVYATRNTIEQWDTDGNPLGTMMVSGFPKRAHGMPGGVEDSNEANAPPDILFLGCAEDTAGEIALLAGDIGSHPRRDVFCVNENGEIVSLFTLPERSSAIRFDAAGRVVAVENRKTVVSCYTLEKAR